MINKEAFNTSEKDSVSPDEIFPLLYSIINKKLDSMSNMENFLQLIADVGAKIVSARNSSLVIFSDNLDFFIPKAKKNTDIEENPFRNIYNQESHITIPLIIRGMKDPFGYLRVECKRDKESFDAKDLFLLLLLSRQATLKIENDLLYKKVHKDLVNALGAMVTILEAKDKYTSSHSQRVTQLALNIAETICLDKKEKDILRLAGLLHDIGKIGVPDTILNKKEELTSDEFNVIKSHPVVGENILQPLEFLAPEKSIIRHHHERLDGSGYPDGIQGEDIPLCTRIIAVADSYDAMTSNRPYRKAKTTMDTLKELESLSDEKYDKEVVKGLKKTLFS